MSIDHHFSVPTPTIWNDIFCGLAKFSVFFSKNSASVSTIICKFCVERYISRSRESERKISLPPPYTTGEMELITFFWRFLSLESGERSVGNAENSARAVSYWKCPEMVCEKFFAVSSRLWNVLLFAEISCTVMESELSRTSNILGFDGEKKSDCHSHRTSKTPIEINNKRTIARRGENMSDKNPDIMAVKDYANPADDRRWFFRHSRYNWLYFACRWAFFLLSHQSEFWA